MKKIQEVEVMTEVVEYDSIVDIVQAIAQGKIDPQKGSGLILELNRKSTQQVVMSLGLKTRNVKPTLKTWLPTTTLSNKMLLLKAVVEKVCVLGNFIPDDDYNENIKQLDDYVDVPKLLSLFGAIAKYAPKEKNTKTNPYELFYKALGKSDLIVEETETEVESEETEESML